MLKAKNSQQRWLLLAVLPLFSVVVLVGCSSGDDNPTTTDPDLTVVGDGNGNSIADAFESAGAADDANGNGISDVYEAPTDAATAATDTNNNSIDDSFEASLTGGADANADGVDDGAAAAVAGGDPCSSDDNDECVLLAQIDEQEALWDSASRDSYVYRYIAIPVNNAEPGCPVFDIGLPSFITVQNGSIVSVNDEVSDFSDSSFRTIDQHFDFMRDNVDRLLPTATYSQALDYPIRFRTANPTEDCPSSSTEYNINVCGDDFDCEL